VIEPLQHRLAIAGKGDAARRERQQLAAAAASDAPTPGELAAAFLSLDGIARDLKTTCERLERQAAGAEMDGQRVAVAALSAQQIRSAEARAKLGGVGGFAPSRMLDPAGSQPRFSVSIVFAGQGTQETFSIGRTPSIEHPRLDAGSVQVGVKASIDAGAIAGRFTGFVPDREGDEGDQDPDDPMDVLADLLK
jgi:hypothetical protein